jgi:hypothetical protein
LEPPCADPHARWCGTLLMDHAWQQRKNAILTVMVAMGAMPMSVSSILAPSLRC